MERRFVVVGVSVLVFSLVVLVYGLWAGLGVTVGVGASGVVLGVILLGLGLLYVEPLTALLGDSIRWCLGGMLRIGEDAGVLDRFVVVGCPRGSSAVVALVRSSGGSLPECRAVVPGLGLAGDVVYLGLSIGLAGAGVAGGLESLLEELLIRRYSAARRVSVERRSDGGVAVVISGLRGEVRELLGYPLNPLDLVVVGGAAIALGGMVVVSSRSLVGDTYRIVVRPFGGGGK